MRNLNVGVRFCGGCNPKYDRRKYLDSVMAKNPEDTFSIAEENVQYDCLLVIGGCHSCCASYEQFSFNHLIKVAVKPQILKSLNP